MNSACLPIRLYQIRELAFGCLQSGAPCAHWLHPAVRFLRSC